MQGSCKIARILRDLEKDTNSVSLSPERGLKNGIDEDPDIDDHRKTAVPVTWPLLFSSCPQQSFTDFPQHQMINSYYRINFSRNV